MEINQDERDFRPPFINTRLAEEGLYRTTR
jgi:hypothetical protein